MKENERVAEKLQKCVNARDFFHIQAIDAESDRKVITIGGHIASPKVFKNEEEAEKAINEKPWDLILSMIFAAMEAVERAKEANPKLNIWADKEEENIDNEIKKED